jgi:hypothetical protein
MNDDFMKKLMVSKAIMEKTDNIKGSPQNSLPQTMSEEFSMPQAKYNIPQEYLQESPARGGQQQPYLSDVPRENTKPVGSTSIDAIKNSKLPDEIKRLMMEHPINQPEQQTSTLSNDLIERATRLMKTGKENNYIPESAKPNTQQSTSPAQIQKSGGEGINYKLIQKMINEAVTKALQENGLIVESAEKSNEIFSFKVGKHVFEGKVTKIKKLS